MPTIPTITQHQWGPCLLGLSPNLLVVLCTQPFAHLELRVRLGTQPAGHFLRLLLTGKGPVPMPDPDPGPAPPPETTEPGSASSTLGPSMLGAATARVTGASGATASSAWDWGRACCSDCCAVRGVHSNSTSTTHKGDDWRIGTAEVLLCLRLGSAKLKPLEDCCCSNRSRKFHLHAGQQQQQA